MGTQGEWVCDDGSNVNTTAQCTAAEKYFGDLSAQNPLAPQPILGV